MSSPDPTPAAGPAHPTGSEPTVAGPAALPDPVASSAPPPPGHPPAGAGQPGGADFASDRRPGPDDPGPDDPGPDDPAPGGGFAHSGGFGAGTGSGSGGPEPGSGYALGGYGPDLAAERDDRHGISEIVLPIVVALVIGALGAGVGWLWAELAPRINLVKVDGGYLYADAEPEQAVAADGWFLIIGAALGVVLAILTWFALRRYRGVAMLVGLAAGSLIGAYVAWWVGHKIGMTEFTRINAATPVGGHLQAPLGLRMTNIDPKALWPPKITGVAAAQALVAVLTYTCLAGFSAYDNLRGPRHRRLPPGPDLA